MRASMYPWLRGRTSESSLVFQMGGGWSAKSSMVLQMVGVSYWASRFRSIAISSLVPERLGRVHTGGPHGRDPAREDGDQGQERGHYHEGHGIPRIDYE